MHTTVKTLFCFVIFSVFISSSFASKDTNKPGFLRKIAPKVLFHVNESKLNYDQTLEQIRSIVENNNYGWKLLKEHDMEKIVGDKYAIFELINAEYMSILFKRNRHKRVSPIITPLKLAVYELDGKTYVSRFNKTIMKHLFPYTVGKVIKKDKKTLHKMLKPLLKKSTQVGYDIAGTAMLPLGLIARTFLSKVMTWELESNLGFEDTVALLKKSVKESKEQLGFKWKIPVDFSVTDFVSQEINKDLGKIHYIALCNPIYAGQILKPVANRFMGGLMPCGWMVYEKKGKTYISMYNLNFLKGVFKGDMIEIVKNMKLEFSKIMKLHGIYNKKLGKK
jgi:uncharacterized protein (DUF302 family)